MGGGQGGKVGVGLAHCAIAGVGGDAAGLIRQVGPGGVDSLGLGIVDEYPVAGQGEGVDLGLGHLGQDGAAGVVHFPDVDAEIDQMLQAGRVGEIDADDQGVGDLGLGIG